MRCSETRRAVGAVMSTADFERPSSSVSRKHGSLCMGTDIIDSCVILKHHERFGGVLRSSGCGEASSDLLLMYNFCSCSVNACLPQRIRCCHVNKPALFSITCA